MSLTATIFGTDSLIFKGANLGTFGLAGYLHKAMNPEPEPQRLGEISHQTAKEGGSRVIIYGRVRPIGGNLIHCQEPIKRFVEQESSGGKGGGSKQKQTVERVSRTYAIGVCEGPITAFTRIWRNGKLVYDGRDGSAWGAKNNKVFLRKFKLYLGGWAQMPSPDLEAIWGVGMVPAYRGTAYMVALKEDLTDLGGAVPQWVFEAERAEGAFFTSRPYAVEEIDGTDQDPASAKSAPAYVYSEATDQPGASIDSGSLRNVLIDYSEYPPEATDQPGAEITGGTLRTPGGTIDYSDYPSEATEQPGAIMAETGILRTVLIRYEEYPPEATEQPGATITGGTLA